MSTAFTLTLAYLGEHYSEQDSASAFAAYITGNVASNLIGRLISAGVADHFGLAANFYFFALLNLAGALLVYFTVEKTPPMKSVGPGMGSNFSAWIMHLKNPSLRASFAIGFCILFAFVGIFTYVNFVLVRPAFQRRRHDAGRHIYFVFLPAIATTPLAGRAVKRFGTRATFWGSLGVAALGLPLMLSPSLAAVLAGMVLVGVGTFFAQATGMGFFDHMLDSFARHALSTSTSSRQGRPAHRLPPHGGGHRHRAGPGGEQGAGRVQGHPPLRPRLYPDGRDPDPLRHRPLQPPLPGLEGGVLARRRSARWTPSCSGVPPRLRHERRRPRALETLYGENNHHIAESGFKALARALRVAVAIDERQAGRVPSTKGTL